MKLSALCSVFLMIPLIMRSSAAVQEICLATGLNLTSIKVVGCPVFEGRMTMPGIISGGNTVITDDTAEFDPLGSFPDCANFTIEFENGAWGIIEDFTTTTITVGGIVLPYICQLDRYIIRQVNTLTTIFGSCECLKLEGGTPAGADFVFVPNGGGWNIYYYSTTFNSWRRIVPFSADDHCWDPIYFVTGIIILRLNPPTTIAVSGDEKEWPTVIDMDFHSDLLQWSPGTGPPSWSCMSSIYMEPQPLPFTGLKNRPDHDCAPPLSIQTLCPDPNPALADVVWLPTVDTDGCATVPFTRYFQSSGPTPPLGCYQFPPITPAAPDITCGLIVQHRCPRPTIMLEAP